MKKYEILLFDLDGTLTDSAPGILNCARHALSIMGRPEPENMLRFVGPPLIDSFLDTLRYEDKYLFMRRYWYADPLREIARTAGMSYGAAAVRLHRVREKLRNYLLKEGVSV